LLGVFASGWRACVLGCRGDCARLWLLLPLLLLLLVLLLLKVFLLLQP